MLYAIACKLLIGFLNFLSETKDGEFSISNLLMIQYFLHYFISFIMWNNLIINCFCKLTPI